MSPRAFAAASLWLLLASPAAPPIYSSVPEARVALPARELPPDRPAALPSEASIPQLGVRGNRPPPGPAARAPTTAAPSPPAALEPATLTATDPGACLSSLHSIGEPDRTRAMVLAVVPGVVPVRIERLVVQETTALLEMVDAWVDPASLGAREFRRVEVPLGLLAAGPRGASIYAARIAGGLIVAAPTLGAATLSDRSGRHGFDCAMVLAFLPVQRGQGSALIAAITRKVRVKLTPVQTNDPERDLIVNLSLSVSQLTHDPEPLLSVTMRADPLPVGIVEADETP